MEITARNFEERFDLVAQAVDEAQFVAIDLEFTGLWMDK